MDEVVLTSDEAAVANRIRAIDAEVDALDERTNESVIVGLHGYGAAMMTNIVQTSADTRRAALLAERADLAEKLKHEVNDDQGGTAPQLDPPPSWP